MIDYTLQTIITRLKKENEALAKKNKMLSKKNTAYKAALIKINGVSMRIINED